jgi:hypothetical protein
MVAQLPKMMLEASSSGPYDCFDHITTLTRPIHPIGNSPPAAAVQSKAAAAPDSL